MTLLQRIHYIWLRTGIALLVLMPLAMFLTFRPWNVPAATFADTAATRVADEDAALIFAPAAPRATGLMILPGCPVDPRAYAPLARAIADAGHVTLIVRVPWRCAPGRSQEQALDAQIGALVERWPEVQFVLAGHSRGGAHTARIAAARRLPFRGFVLMGTSHPRELDLSSLPVPMTKIAATRDGVAGEAQFDGRRLPPSTTWVRIEGGNHSQFGHYAFQLFDHVAQITRADQQAQIAAALLAALAR